MFGALCVRMIIRSQVLLLRDGGPSLLYLDVLLKYVNLGPSYLTVLTSSGGSQINLGPLT